MIANLKPYPEYKDSGVAWLGDVPKHWEVSRNKHLLNEVSNRSEDGAEELLTVSHYTGITKRRDRIVDDTDLLTTAKSLVGYKKVEKNNLVMNIMLAWNGSLGISSFSGIVSPAYCVFAINQDALSPKYLHYLHRSPLYTGIFKTASTGVIDSRLRLYPEKYFSLVSSYPPTQEQTQIARFLDYKTAQIARFIKAKKRMIELLKEQKQVIINDAVTGKIDVATGKPYRQYKDSGVEWLGQVPEGWEVRRLRTVLQKGLQNGIFKRKDFFGRGTLLINVSDLYNNNNHEITHEHLDRVEVSESELKSFCVKNRDIFFVRSSLKLEGTGKSAIIKDIVEPMVFECHVVKCSPSDKVIPEFLIQLLNSTPLLNWIISRANTVTMSTVSQNIIMNIPVLIFSKEEQLQILIYIETKTTALDLTISRTEREIGLMQEYRTRLISDVVTGKIDVRDIEIPDIAGIDDTIDETIDEPEVEEDLETAEGEK